jgi:MoxR-like ATPase
MQAGVMIGHYKKRDMEDKFSQARLVLDSIQDNLAKVMHSQSQGVRWLTAAFASGGHVLLEDAPGTGKTTMAKAFALSVEAQFKRIQFTPDLLPSDILGVSVFNQDKQSFQFREGPIFTQILLADEINRASPRTQSALLEAMAEGQVSVEGVVRHLEKPFIVIATQNPIDFHGAYPLPEAQMDRFALRFSLGYLPVDEETALLSALQLQHPLELIKPCVTLDQVLPVLETVRQVRISQEVQRYIVQLVNATRSAPGIRLGASPRASITLMKTAQALTIMDGREFVSPESVQELAQPVLSHRLVLDSEARFSGKTSGAIVHEIVNSIPIPA